MNRYTLPSKLASVERIDGGFEGDMPVTGSKRNDALIEAMSELYKLQAENERLRQENAEFKAQQLKADLLVMSNARRLIKAKAITSNGLLYMELFGTGMGTGRERCRALGLDPDSNKTSYRLTRSEGK